VRQCWPASVEIPHALLFGAEEKGCRGSLGRLLVFSRIFGGQDFVELDFIHAPLPADLSTGLASDILLGTGAGCDIRYLYQLVFRLCIQYFRLPD